MAEDEPIKKAKGARQKVAALPLPVPAMTPMPAVMPVVSVEPLQAGSETAMPADRPVPSPVPAPEAVQPVAGAAEAAVSASRAAASQIDEAAASPAVESDATTPEPETLAPLIEEMEEMATMAPETMAPEAMAETVSEMPAEAADKMQAMFGDMTGRFKAALEKSQKLGEEMVELAKGNVEAMVASARVAAKGGETIGQEVGDYGRRSVEHAVATMKSFASVKSPTELFQLQSDYLKASFDGAVAEASKLSESMLRIAGEATQPLSSRYAVAAEKIKSATL